MDVDEEPGGSAPSAPATKLQEMRRRDDLDPSARMRSEGWKIPPVQNLPIPVGPKQKEKCKAFIQDIRKGSFWLGFNNPQRKGCLFCGGNLPN